MGAGVTYLPPQVTEREDDGTWEDCTWCSGVMHANALRGRTVFPGTRTEYEGLRVDGDDGPAEKPGDGSNLNQLRAGMLVRYGFAGDLTPNGADWPTVRARLVEGTTAVVQGKMGAFPAGHRLRRWDPTFAGGHAVHVVIENGGPWWQNPEAPAEFQGEAISWSELQAFYEALRPAGAACMIGRVGQYPPAPAPPLVPVLIQELPGATVTIGRGARIRSTPEIRSDNVLVNGIPEDRTWTLGRLVRGGTDPQTGRDDWFQADGIGYTAAGNAVGGITPAPTPVPDPVILPPDPAPTTQPGSSDAPPVGGEPEAPPPPADGTPAGGPDLSDHDRELLEGAGLIQDGQLLTRDQVVEKFSQSPAGDGE